MLIQPVTNIAAAIPSGQCRYASMAAARYCRAISASCQRQSRGSSTPVAVNAAMTTAAHAPAVAIKLSVPSRNERNEKHKEEKTPHDAGLALHRACDAIGQTLQVLARGSPP